MKLDEGEKIMGFCRLLVMVLIAGFMACPLAAEAEELVSGSYLKGVGKEITIELVIGSPAPPLVIVTQKLPKGTKVISAMPALKKYSPKKGVAKWLLNKVRPGKMTISLKLERPIAKGEISGEIRYRNEAGKMISVTLKN